MKNLFSRVSSVFESVLSWDQHRTLCVDKDTKDTYFSSVRRHDRVSSYRPLKACACLRAHILVLSPPYVLSSAKNCVAHSSPHLSAKRETQKHLVSSAPQTNRTHISTLFELWIKGSLAFLNFLGGGWWSFLTLPSCIQPFLEEPPRSGFQFLSTCWSYSLLDL